MNIGLLILIVIGGAAGGLSTLYIAVSLFGTLGYKIYRKIRYGMSLYS
ncbi:MAG: hypothetical protein HFI62_02485 [Lachnospiraceae bacterium]|jgi:hypothetical protein|nr:hypothetical protein [Lachnospiraceae bacterium]